MKTKCEPAYLLELMNRECEILDRILEKGNDIREPLKTRDWENLQSRMNGVKRLSAEFELLEQERSNCFKTLVDMFAFPGKATIYDLSGRLQKEMKDSILASYRGLKIKILRYRLYISSVGIYAKTNNNILRKVLETLFPEKKGTIYTEKGNTRSTMDPVMVRKHA